MPLTAPVRSMVVRRQRARASSSALMHARCNMHTQLGKGDGTSSPSLIGGLYADPKFPAVATMLANAAAMGSPRSPRSPASIRVERVLARPTSSDCSDDATSVSTTPISEVPETPPRPPPAAVTNTQGAERRVDEARQSGANTLPKTNSDKSRCSSAGLVQKSPCTKSHQPEHEMCSVRKKLDVGRGETVGV